MSELYLASDKIHEIRAQAVGDESFVDTLEDKELPEYSWGDYKPRALFFEQTAGIVREYIEEQTRGGIFLLPLLVPLDLEALNRAREDPMSDLPQVKLTYGIADFGDDGSLRVESFYGRRDITEEVMQAGQLPPKGALPTLPSLLLATTYSFSKTPSEDIYEPKDLLENADEVEGNCAFLAEVTEDSVRFYLSELGDQKLSCKGIEGGTVYFKDRVRMLSPLSIPAVVSGADVRSIQEGKVSPALYEVLGFLANRAIKSFSLEDPLDEARRKALSALGFSEDSPLSPYVLTYADPV